jgi:flagellar biosynthesis protein FlhF
MFVRKFEGDTLEEALNGVKRELGPNAIILKTLTNKGVRGAFKKKRIEITAAISETDYVKKAKVDSVLSEDQKNDFYNSKSENINKMINNYSGQEKQVASPGYGSMGLNKIASTVRNAASSTSTKVKSGLDDFLNSPPVMDEHTMQPYESTNNSVHDFLGSEETHSTPTQSFTETPIAPVPQPNLELKHELKQWQNKVEYLEQKLTELSQNMIIGQTIENKDDGKFGLKSLRQTLKAVDLEDRIINTILKKAQFELNQDELEDEDTTYEFALREINSMILTKMPLFSSVENNSSITILVSDVACGQSAMALKLASLIKDSEILTVTNTPSNTGTFSSEVLGINVHNATSLSQAISIIRKVEKENRNIIIDFRLDNSQMDETKNYIDSLKRSFRNIEILVNISAIHSEIFNRRIIAKYKLLADGIIINHVDLCMSFGSLINVHCHTPDLPFVFFGTGKSAPKDIEHATSERLVSGLFKL